MTREEGNETRFGLMMSISLSFCPLFSRARVSQITLLVAVLTLMARHVLQADCSLTSTGVVPLNDLGPGSYNGFVGGLYPAGSNTPPSAHAAAAIAIATDQIQPLDSSGNPDPVNGRIVMISIGMSNTTQEFATKGNQNFKQRADADPAKNPRLLIVDGAQGGQDATAWIDPKAQTWSTVNQRLSAAGVAPEQVQVAWLKQALAGPNNYGAFPAHAQALQADLEIILRNLKTKFPNIRLTYLSPRSRAYTNVPTALNPEPFAYETGFAGKWTIEDQINGVGNLNFDPANGPVVAPLVLWGSYIWADGLSARSDGLTWLCSDLESDFTHPSATGGVPKVADQLLAFFKTDPTTTPWFLRHTVSGQPPTVTADASVSTGAAPLSVSFTAIANDPDGTIAAYQWTFDDGTFSTSQNPAKIFPAPGNYSVHLTVTDNSGNTTLRTLPIAVTPAQITPTPTPGATGTPGATPTPPTTTPTPTPATVSISGGVSYCVNPSPGPVSGVTLNLAGSATGSTLSDASGNYQFSSLVVGGNYSVTPSKTPRPAGSAGINTVDVIAIQRHFLSLGSPLTGCRLLAANVNGDAAVNTVDVVAVQRFFLGLTTGLAETGKYRFSPAVRNYSGLGSSQSAQNYQTLVFGDVASPFVE